MIKIDDQNVMGGDPRLKPSHAISKYQRNIQLNLVTEDRPLSPGRQVWIVAHGWNSDLANFERMAQEISLARPDDTVLTVDLSQASDYSITQSNWEFCHS